MSRMDQQLEDSSVYLQLLNSIANDRGWGEAERLAFESWKEKVAEIESNNIADRVQTSGGPGRGKYQYELEEGGSGANNTAKNRLKALIGDDLPGVSEADRAELNKADPDFSKLSEDLQDALFLADKQNDPKTKLDTLVTGQVTEADAWADWHWKGAKEDRPAKIEMFKGRFASDAQPDTVTVKEGDWLSKIAAERGLDVGELKKANPGINYDEIKPGQVLQLPISKDTTSVVDQDGTVYEVANVFEDTLDFLEEGYDYTKSQLARLFS